MTVSTKVFVCISVCARVLSPFRAVCLAQRQRCLTNADTPKAGTYIPPRPKHKTRRVVGVLLDTPGTPSHWPPGSLRPPPHTRRSGPRLTEGLTVQPVYQTVGPSVRLSGTCHRAFINDNACHRLVGELKTFAFDVPTAGLTDRQRAKYRQNCLLGEWGGWLGGWVVGWTVLM